MAGPPAGKSGGEPAGAVDDALPGDACPSGRSDPSYLTRRMRLSRQRGHLPVRHHTGARDRSDNPLHPLSKGQGHEKRACGSSASDLIRGVTAG